MSATYPLVSTTDLDACRDFYTGFCGFELGVDLGWFILFTRSGHSQLGFIDAEHPSLPKEHNPHPAGVVITVEVDRPGDLDAAHEQVVARNMPLVLAPRDEEWRQRHMLVTDPNGLLVDVVADLDA